MLVKPQFPGLDRGRVGNDVIALVNADAHDEELQNWGFACTMTNNTLEKYEPEYRAFAQRPSTHYTLQLSSYTSRLQQGHHLWQV